MVFRMLIMLLGVWACSTGVIMVKSSHMHPVLLASYRLLVAAAALSPLFVRDLQRHARGYGWRHVRRTVLPGLFLAGHLSTWIFGTRLTQAAHASLIVNMMPIVMPFILYFMIRERVTLLETAGSALALAGVALLAWNDLRVSAGHLAGDGACMLSMTMLAMYMALARRNRDFPTLWLYVTPMYLVAGLVNLAIGLTLATATGAELALESSREIWLILGLALIPTVMGHTIINYSMKHFRGQLVSIVSLGEFIFAGLMAYFILDEEPRWPFYAASVLVVAGAVLALRDTPQPVVETETVERASAG